MKTVKFIDLFAGIGGLRLGFEQALQSLGLIPDCLLSSEIDKEARQVYEANFSETPKGDIKTIPSLPPHDVLLAGFPCQSFSYAGKKAGFGDTRGTLFFEILRLIDTQKPKAFIFENVRGLVTHDQGKTLNTIRLKMQERGYSFDLFLLNSSNYGVPQNRVRAYMMGVLNKTPHFNLVSDLGAKDSHSYESGQLSLFSAPKQSCKVRDILQDNPPQHYDCSRDFTAALKTFLQGDLEKLHGVRLIDYRGGNSIHSWELGLRGDCTSEEIELMNRFITKRRNKVFGQHQDGKLLTEAQISSFYQNPNLRKLLASLVNKNYLQVIDNKYKPVAGNFSFEVYKFIDPDKISVTLVASDANRLGVYHRGRVRRITPREAARLQGFPDSFQLHPNETKAYRQLGNSVTIPVVKAIAHELLQNLIPIAKISCPGKS
ncbi:MAG: DNA (cytosine-5-)-methyltransferase [Phormidium sp.]